jgi:hypothetical protein
VYRKDFALEHENGGGWDNYTVVEVASAEAR